MKDKLKNTSIVVRVDEETKKAIEQLAVESRRDLSDYLRLILEDTIKKKVKI